MMAQMNSPNNDQYTHIALNDWPKNWHFRRLAMPRACTSASTLLQSDRVGAPLHREKAGIGQQAPSRNLAAAHGIGPFMPAAKVAAAFGNGPLVVSETSRLSRSICASMPPAPGRASSKKRPRSQTHPIGSPA